MGKFKRTDPFARLTSEQKDFIKMKVLELGNLKNVRSFYNKDALVDRFALQVARMIFAEDR
jgi:hypothetical protein